MRLLLPSTLDSRAATVAIAASFFPLLDQFLYFSNERHLKGTRTRFKFHFAPDDKLFSTFLADRSAFTLLAQMKPLASGSPFSTFCLSVEDNSLDGSLAFIDCKETRGLDSFSWTELYARDDAAAGELDKILRFIVIESTRAACLNVIFAESDSGKSLPRVPHIFSRRLTQRHPPVSPSSSFTLRSHRTNGIPQRLIKKKVD